MEPNQDWKSLAETWQHQPVPGLDVAALGREVKRRGKALRWVIVGEIAMTVLVVLACLMILLMPDADLFEQLLFSALGLFLVGYQWFMVRLRVRDLEKPGLDALAMVDLEIRRGLTTLSYWRLGMWTGLGLWVVLYGVVLLGWQLDWSYKRVVGLGGGLAINVVLFPAMGIYGWWRCRRERARLARYHALRDQLRAPLDPE